MLIKFLKEVVTIVVGKQAEDIVDLLVGKKNVNEFLITKKLGLTINQTRNILYKLSNYGLVSSIRKKDKKKGWYTYFWKIEVLKCLEFLQGFLGKRIDQFSSQIRSRETKIFYNCEKCNIEFTEENALAHDFICNECGEVFTIKDNAKLLKEFRKSLTRLRNESELVKEEIRKIKEKEEKKKFKEIAKIKKEKAAKMKIALKKRKIVKIRKSKISDTTKSKTAPTRRKQQDFVGKKKSKKIIKKKKKSASKKKKKIVKKKVAKKKKIVKKAKKKPKKKTKKKKSIKKKKKIKKRKK